MRKVEKASYEKAERVDRLASKAVNIIETEGHRFLSMHEALNAMGFSDAMLGRDIPYLKGCGWIVRNDDDMKDIQ